MTTSRLGLLVGLAVVLLALASPACFVRGDAAASDSALVWSDQRAVCHEACHADEYAQIAACGLSTECVNQVESSISECDAACDKAPSVVAPAAHTQVGGIPCELACLISEKTASLLCHAYDDAAIKAKCLSNLDIAVTICQVACLFTPIMAEKPEAALAAPVPEADDGSASDMPESEYRTQFAAFVKKYQKKYTTDEFFPRYAIFKANLNKIRNHASTRSTYSMAVNEFADMTFTEFHTKMTGYKRRDIDALRRANSEGPHSKIDVLASSVDWRQKNAVTPVKNQQQCGSCWAFSTTGSTEGAHAIKTGDLVSLSEQQLVDCSGAQGNQGCNGGMMDQGFQYIITNGGITTEDAYPYTATQGTCNTNTTVAATLSSFVDVTPGSETALMQAVNLGPVSVAIEADQQCFQFYSGGVLSDPSCGTNLDHGVLVVGYGTDTTVSPAADYWIVKNSWGESWGENGYIRLARGSNECGIATEPSYPVV